jgi:hypothetical protein
MKGRPQCHSEDSWSYAPRTVDSLCDPVIEETLFVSQGQVDGVVWLVPVDISTDEEKHPDNVIGTVEIQGVVEKLEIRYTSTKACENNWKYVIVPSMYVKQILWETVTEKWTRWLDINSPSQFQTINERKPGTNKNRKFG